MIARIHYRLKSWLCRRAMERACPELRTLRLAREKVTKRHGKSSQIAAKQTEVLHRAIGWRGTR